MYQVLLFKFRRHLCKGSMFNFRQFVVPYEARKKLNCLFNKSLGVLRTEAIKTIFDRAKFLTMFIFP